MQIVKGDRNSPLRKNERVHLRKNEFPGKYGSTAKKPPSAPYASSMGGSCGEYYAAGRQLECPGGIHTTFSQKKRLEKMERPKTICQGPAGWQNTNDDDAII